MTSSNQLLAASAVCVAVIAILVARISNLRHARRAREHAAPPPIGPDGVIVGANSIRLAGSSRRGMLILHGFNDTPQSVEEMAHAFHAQGWTVHAPLLAQHGRGAELLAREGRAEDWLSGARDEWRELCALTPTAVLVGQSVGAALAVTLTAEAPPAALVLLAPYLSMGVLVRAAARVWPLWSVIAPVLLSLPERALHDPAARARSLSEGRFTPRLVNEVRRVVDQAARHLAAVRSPTLAICSPHDYRISQAAAERAFAQLGSVEKQLEWQPDAGHIITADIGRETLFATVAAWLDRVLTAAAKRASSRSH